ncbi:MAG: MtnX-like HAD-IB family phosphatase [Planctomycetota bacterium]
MRAGVSRTRGRRGEDAFVLLDFDGTIASEDIGNAILERFADPAWRVSEARWLAGEISTRENLEYQWSLVKGERKAIIEFASAATLRAGFKGFLARAREAGSELLIASDGIEFYVRAFLRAHGIAKIPVRTNRMTWGPPRRFTFPYASVRCSRHGTCKCALMEDARKRGLRPVVVGDGYSDLCAARRADRIFARGFLAEKCAQEGLAYAAFEDFGEVADALFGKGEL